MTPMQQFSLLTALAFLGGLGAYYEAHIGALAVFDAKTIVLSVFAGVATTGAYVGGVLSRNPFAKNGDKNASATDAPK